MKKVIYLNQPIKLKFVTSQCEEVDIDYNGKTLFIDKVRKQKIENFVIEEKKYYTKENNKYLNRHYEIYKKRK